MMISAEEKNTEAKGGRFLYRAVTKASQSRYHLHQHLKDEGEGNIWTSDGRTLQAEGTASAKSS